MYLAFLSTITKGHGQSLRAEEEWRAYHRRPDALPDPAPPPRTHHGLHRDWASAPRSLARLLVARESKRPEEPALRR